MQEQLANLFNYQEIQMQKDSNIQSDVIGLYTSYHSVSKDGDIVISSSKPRWSNLDTAHYKILNPFHIIKGANPFELSDGEYILRFIDGLSRLNAKDIYGELKYLSKDEIPTIVCYEKPTDMCHRHIVAQWLSDELGIQFVERSIKDKNLIFSKERFLYTR